MQEVAYRACQVFRQIILNPKRIMDAGIFKLSENERAKLQNLSLPELIPVSRSFLGEDLKGEVFSSSALKVLDSAQSGVPSFSTADQIEADIRLIWEPARLQQASLLLIYSHRFPTATDNKQAKQEAKRIIFEWIEENPFGQGVHFTSAMECALRIPVFFYTLKLLDNLNQVEYDLLIGAIYRHAYFISKRLSLYSSLGNHTIAEAVGLIFAGAIFKTISEGKRWFKTGIRLLEQELPHQILSDGGPGEQSINYHRFVLDLYWLAIDFMKKNNLSYVQEWKPRLTLGESFIKSFRDENGRFPAIGDSDDGYAIAPGIVPNRVTGLPCYSKVVTYKESGYTVVRKSGLIFTFDHGPLGMPPLYNHGHADALSITMAKDEIPILVDPGTYRYNGVPAWRRYFKGTSAHNTVTIDGQDQAIQENSFIWSKPFKTILTDVNYNNDNLFCSAFHNGYTRLKEPVWHQRSFLFFDKANFLIRDRFWGKGIHSFQLNYHLHPDTHFLKDGEWWIIKNGSAQIIMRLLHGEFQYVRGQERPLLGWYSSRYGENKPTGVLTSTVKGQVKTVSFTTAIFTESIIVKNYFEERIRQLDEKIENT